ncbi:MAG TPA: Hpt domain-containing protein, partial [Planctomycetaceae bacterium]
ASRKAHNLKGVAGTVACRRVRATAERLEDAARGGDLDGLRARLDELRDCCRRLREEPRPVGC